MIVLKTNAELEKMRVASRITAEAIELTGEYVKPGVSTLELDTIAEKYIRAQGAEPNFLHLYDFPNTACISVNEEIIHGIPKKDRILKEGDIVTIDLGAKYDGYNGDSAYTFAVGTIAPEVERLLQVTNESLFKGIEQAVPGNRVGDIGHAVQEYCESRGYGVIREYEGHGIGTKVHEEPGVPNYGRAGRGPRLLPGMTICIEPMISLGSPKIRQLADGWTVVTADGSPSAHFERLIAITDNGPEILTKFTNI